jgi:hypothetical protein
VAHAGAAEPEVLAAARIAPEVDELFVDARADAGRAHLARPALRDVHVEQHALARAERAGDGHRLEQLKADAHAELRRRVQVGSVVRARRDGGDAAQGALARGGHGAGVERVLPQVHAVVDAAHDQIGPPRQDARARVERDVHAVGRRSVEREHARLDRPQPQRPVQAERMARGALLVLRGQNDDVRDRGQRGAHGPDAGACVPVVVREQHERSRGRSHRE